MTAAWARAWSASLTAATPGGSARSSKTCRHGARRRRPRTSRATCGPSPLGPKPHPGQLSERDGAALRGPVPMLTQRAQLLGPQPGGSVLPRAGVRHAPASPAAPSPQPPRDLRAVLRVHDHADLTIPHRRWHQRLRDPIGDRGVGKRTQPAAGLGGVPAPSMPSAGPARLPRRRSGLRHRSRRRSSSRAATSLIVGRLGNAAQHAARSPARAKACSTAYVLSRPAIPCTIPIAASSRSATARWVAISPGVGRVRASAKSRKCLVDTDDQRNRTDPYQRPPTRPQPQAQRRLSLIAELMILATEAPLCGRLHGLGSYPRGARKVRPYAMNPDNAASSRVMGIG